MADQEFDADTARGILREELAKSFVGADSVQVPLDNNGEIQRYWVLNENRFLSDCEDFLETYVSEKNSEHSSFVIDPMVDQITRRGTYRSAFVRSIVRGEEGSMTWMLIQTLRRNFITNLVNGSTLLFNDARQQAQQVLPAQGNFTDENDATAANGEEGYLVLEWTGVDPDSIKAVQAEVDALSGTFEPKARGKSYGTGWYKLFSSSTIEDDGSATLIVSFADGRYSIDSYTDAETSREELIYTHMNVPKVLVIPMINTWKALGRSATHAKQSDGLYTVVLRAKGVDDLILADVMTALNCSSQEFTSYYFGILEAALPTIEAPSVQGYTSTVAYSDNGDGTFNARVTDVIVQYRQQERYLSHDADDRDTYTTDHLGVTDATNPTLPVAATGKVVDVDRRLNADCSEDIRVQEHEIQNQTATDRRTSAHFTETTSKQTHVAGQNSQTTTDVNKELISTNDPNAYNGFGRQQVERTWSPHQGDGGVKQTGYTETEVVIDSVAAQEGLPAAVPGTTVSISNNPNSHGSWTQNKRTRVTNELVDTTSKAQQTAFSHTATSRYANKETLGSLVRTNGSIINASNSPDDNGRHTTVLSRETATSVPEREVRETHSPEDASGTAHQRSVTDINQVATADFNPAPAASETIDVVSQKNAFGLFDNTTVTRTDPELDSNYPNEVVPAQDFDGEYETRYGKAYYRHIDNVKPEDLKARINEGDMGSGTSNSLSVARKINGTFALTMTKSPYNGSGGNQMEIGTDKYTDKTIEKTKVGAAKPAGAGANPVEGYWWRVITTKRTEKISDSASGARLQAESGKQGSYSKNLNNGFHFGVSIDTVSAGAWQSGALN